MSEHYNPLYQPPGAPAPLPQVELTDPARARDHRPRIVSRLQGLEHGQAILARLAVGDRSALVEAGVLASGTYDTQAHEWALGRKRADGSYYLVTGGPNMVDWGAQAVQGLDSVSHTHPWEDIDRAAVSAELAPTVAAALRAWLVRFSELPIANMPGKLWYLFPSNGDLGSAYLTSHQESELVYTPFRLAPDGWLSSSEGVVLTVEFGPVRIVLRPDTSTLVEKRKADLAKSDGMAETERVCMQFLSAPVTFRAGHSTLVSGFLQIDPVGGLDGRSPQMAWFSSQAPNRPLTKAAARQLLLTLAGY